MTKIVTVIPSEKYNFNILSCSVSNGDNVEVELITKLSKEEDIEKTIYEIHIKNIRKTLGRYYEAIHLTTDFKVRPKLTIRVFGNIKQKN